MSSNEEENYEEDDAMLEDTENNEHASEDEESIPSQINTEDDVEQDEDAYIMGIDEAGRGPVLGPLVYASMFCKVKYNSGNFLRKTFQVNDSKQLSAKTRNKIFDSLKENSKIIHYMTSIIQSDEISHKMLSRRKYNLNLISHDCAIELIQKASDVLAKTGKYLREVYIDTVGDPKKYQTKLEEKFPEIQKIVVDKKADSKYPVVGAASIVAKVTRDDIIDNITKQQDAKLKMGSGYTSDKYTKDFLKKTMDNVFGYDHHIVRFSWSTITKLLDDDAVEVEWSDDEFSESNDNQSKISFHIGAAGTQKQRIDFMNSRNMELVTDF